MTQLPALPSAPGSQDLPAWRPLENRPATEAAAGALVSSPEYREILVRPSSASALGLGVRDIIGNGLNAKIPNQTGTVAVRETSLAEQVFDALVKAKVWTSRVAMHIDRAARDRYFRQLDLLHDCDEWFEGEEPLLLESYKTFIRVMLLIGGGSKPSLALAPDGHLLAVWQLDGDRLTMEFKERDRVEFTVSQGRGDRMVRAAMAVPLDQLLHNLGPFHPEKWFGGAS